MFRTFETNKIREVKELSGSDWTFEPLSGEREGEKIAVSVPCLWETIPGFEAFRGQGIFSKEFEGSGMMRIICKGVSHSGTVRVDGKVLGSHYNAYTEFSFITPDLEEGSHLLEIEVDNTFSEKSALHIPNDYMTYGGINRAVIVEKLDQVLIERIHAVPKKTEEGWKVDVKVRIRNVSETPFAGDLKLCIRDSKQAGSSPIAAFSEKTELAAGETQIIEKELEVSEVSLWSPENPKLYRVRAVIKQQETEVDDLIERIGFREFRTEGKDILLNGKKLRIKGFCRHEDHGAFANALPLQVLQQDLQIVKDLGGNAVRTSHYPNDERFLDLCDEQGIILWEENHARGLTEEMMRNPNFEDQAETCIREMIDAHINHPAILIWGILNECASETEYGRTCYEAQYKLLHELDPSRPRSSASCKFKTDICFDLPDIVSYNIYPEWYVEEPAKDYLEDLYSWVQNESEGSGKPFLITEVGAGGIYGYHSETYCKWSEEYQAKALGDQITAVLNQDGCSGIFIWMFADCRISYEWFATRPKTMNNKGVVDEFRRHKMAYRTVKELFHQYGNYFES